MEKNSLKNDKGLSIIEVMVAFALIGILALATTTIVTNQTKEFKSIEEKFSINNLETIVSSRLDNLDYCNCFFKTHTYDFSTSSWNTFPNSVSNGFDTSCNPVGTPLLTVGVTMGNLKPSSMVMLDNMQEVVIGTGNYAGKIEIKFDADTLVRARKPLLIPVFFSFDLTTPVNARQVSSCSPSGGQLQYTNATQFSVTINRKNDPYVPPVTTSPGQYKLCFLSSVGSGGNQGGGGDRCEVTYNSGAQTWSIHGSRGDDPAITCKMYCIP